MFFPDQHNNRDNNRCHYETTAPEIWRQMEGRIDVFVGGIGTGGTVSGVGRYLKDQDPKIRVVAVDVEGSVFSRHFAALSGTEDDSAAPGRYLLEGLGDEEIIDCPEFDVFDRMLQVSDAEAFLAARELAREEAMLVGGSSGAALWGVRQILPDCTRGARVVTLFPDSGTRYLSTIYSDDWLREHGPSDGAHRRSVRPVAATAAQPAKIRSLTAGGAPSAIELPGRRRDRRRRRCPRSDAKRPWRGRGRPCAAAVPDCVADRRSRPRGRGDPVPG